MNLKTCSMCNTYKKESEKYKKLYEQAKSGLSEDERNIIIELICQEQLLHIIPKDGYESDTYSILEKLKAKIRTV